MKKGVFAGSFDPVTIGHVNVIEKASKLFDELVVGLLINQDKEYTFSLETRLNALKDSLVHLPNVTVKFYDGLLVDFLKRENTVYFVRGVRNDRDIIYEDKIRKINQSLYPQIEYVILYADENLNKVSSTYAKEMINSGQDVSSIIPSKALRYFIK